MIAAMHFAEALASAEPRTRRHHIALVLALLESARRSQNTVRNLLAGNAPNAFLRALLSAARCSGVDEPMLEKLAAADPIFAAEVGALSGWLASELADLRPAIAGRP